MELKVSISRINKRTGNIEITGEFKTSFAWMQNEVFTSIVEKISHDGKFPVSYDGGDYSSEVATIEKGEWLHMVQSFRVNRI